MTVQYKKNLYLINRHFSAKLAKNKFKQQYSGQNKHYPLFLTAAR